LRTLIYSIRTALSSLWHERWINLLSVLSISIGLLILGVFIAVAFNMDSALKRWSKNFGLVVYLQEGLSSEAEEDLRVFFLKDPDIEGVKYISKEEALQELRRILGKNGSVLEGFESNPLPSSFELSLKDKSLEPPVVRRKAAQIKLLEGVEDVEYGEQWLSSLNALSGIMKFGVVFLGGAIFVAIAFITYSTVKILFYRRRDEIETLKLLGATRFFIRLPFLLEGLFVGISGGAVSSLALWGIYSLVLHKGPEYLPSISGFLVQLPLTAYVPALLAGAVMSFTGSLIAVGKIRY